METQTKTKTRALYIDNLRIFLIALVVLHHLAITYGGPGGWFYNESSAGFPEILPLSMFVATNQAFFMGMFFFISAYFIIPSFQRKGIGKYSKDRLIRLGIPTLLFFFILFPLTVFIRDQYIFGEDASFLNLLKHAHGFGPMWFVEALLIFNFSYLLLKLIQRKSETAKVITLPGTWTIILFAALIGLGQFIIRIWLPVGWAMPFTDFQLPFFLQYIFLFALGIIAYQQKWLDSITPRMGWRWFIFVQVLILIVFPVLFTLGGAAEAGVEPFMGGFNWKCFAYAIWEQLVGIGMIVALFGIFKSRFNKQGSVAKKLSTSAYAVYVFHTPILLLISAIFLDFSIPQILKFVVLAPIALLVCFAVGYLIKNLPLAKKVF